MNRRRATSAVLGLLAASGAACVLFLASHDAGPVFETGIEPVTLRFDAPAYTAGTREGLLIRLGDHLQVVPGSGGRWLPSGPAGTVLMARNYAGTRQAIVDPATGKEGASLRSAGTPSRSVTQVNVLREKSRHSLHTYDLDLGTLWSVVLPKTDNPDATASNLLERDYSEAVPTVGGSTFVQWSDGSEYYEDGDYGVLLVTDEGRGLDNVLVNDGIVALYLSSDGAALLAVRQPGADPCGGCVVTQEIVEIDPDTGEIAATYGMPDGYKKTWRVRAVDKVGDRVAVRFDATHFAPDPRTPQDPDNLVPVTEERGTWVFDGAWSMIPGSTKELTWWQGTEERVVARVLDDPKDPDGYQLYWLHDGREEKLPGELQVFYGNRGYTGSVAGQLLSPVG